MIDDRVVSSKRKKHLLKVQFIGRNPGHTHVGAEPANSNFYRKEIHHTSVLRGKVEDPELKELTDLLPTIDLKGKTSSTVKKYSGAFLRWKTEQIKRTT